MEGRSKTSRTKAPEGFDVTAVIGRVDFTDVGTDDTPHEAAFRLIARYDNEGTFKFPMADGRTCAVTVDWEGRDIAGDM